MVVRRRRGMSGGKKLLFTFVLAAVAFAYQYVRSPSFRRQCGSVFAEWRGNAPSQRFFVLG